MDICFTMCSNNWYFNLCTVATLCKCSSLLRSVNIYEGASVHLRTTSQPEKSR